MIKKRYFTHCKCCHCINRYYLFYLFLYCIWRPVIRLKRTYAAAMEMQVRFQRKPSKHREKKWGLDKPFFVQYFNWLGILRGNFGESYTTNRPVLEEIGSKIGPYLDFICCSFICYIINFNSSGCAMRTL